MKKVYLPLFVIAALASSCQKSYQCSCTTVTGQSGSSSGNSTTKNESVYASSTADAQSKCNADAKASIAGSGGTYNCTVY